MTLWQEACDPLSPSYAAVHRVVDPQGRRRCRRQRTSITLHMLYQPHI